jgi:hypothetical protein
MYPTAHPSSSECPQMASLKSPSEPPIPLLRYNTHIHALRKRIQCITRVNEAEHFREHPEGELRRKPLPRGWVDKENRGSIRAPATHYC